MWRALLSLILLFAFGRIAFLFLDRLGPRERLSWIELTVYSFSLGYAVLTIVGVVLAQFGLLTSSISVLVILALPGLAVCFWIYRGLKRNSYHALDLTNEDQAVVGKQGQSILKQTKRFLSSIRLSHIALLSIFAVGIILRLETQLTAPWLGDQDPYYHLSFIDSIVAQGALPSRTFWGAYSYPPSFHVVLAVLVSVTQVDQYALMKIVPEFIGFLCVPAVYVLIRKKYGEWAGIASGAFWAIGSYQIYRTNIAIPEPIALLGVIMFFYSMATQVGTKKYLLAGLFASMVFLTNVIAILYFFPCIVGIFLATLILRRWNEGLAFLKATFIGFAFSGVFWLPTLSSLGLSGILKGLGPSYSSGTAFSFTSHTMLIWVGWGACALALVGLSVCLRDYRNSLVLLTPTGFFLFLFEAANSGFVFFDPSVLFRGLLFLGTWIALLAGVGFGRVMQMKRKKVAVAALAVMVVLTMVSFPVLSGERYPVTWGYDNADSVYRSYHENYADVFRDKGYMVYSVYEYAFNYGAFANVILDREVPQIGEALLNHESSRFTDFISEYKIKYLIFRSGMGEVDFLAQSNLTSTYYENEYTTVLVIK